VRQTVEFVTSSSPLSSADKALEHELFYREERISD
jgi:hypothetical protein